MNTFPSLTDAEIDAILKYVETYPEPGAGGKNPNEGPSTQVEESDNSLLYGILTLILAVIMLVLLQVNSNLKKLSDDKSGVPSHEPIPFYRNKVYITFLVLVLFVVGGYYVYRQRLDWEGNRIISLNNRYSSPIRYIRAQTRSAAFIVMEVPGIRKWRECRL